MSAARTLPGYLLVPRPKDMIKGLLLPLTFTLGAIAVGDVSREAVVRALVVWAALELLVYPARYQWNDVRGFVADQSHPGERDRGRLPGPLDRARPHVTASCVVAVGRLALVAVLALALPGLRLGGVLTAVVAGVFGVAIVYEALRSGGTGRAGDVPRVGVRLVAVWIVVGAGYAVRGVTGLVLAVDGPARPALLVAAVVATWAFGVAFVTSRWAIEALAFARVEDGRLRWTARAEHAREHLLALVRWLPSQAPSGDPAGWAALRGRTPPTAPWNVAVVVAGAAAALTGALLVGSTSAVTAVAAAVTGAVAAVIVVLVARGRAATVVAGAVALATVLALCSAPRPIAAALPWLALLIAHVVFTRQRLDAIGHAPPVVRRAATAVLAPLGRAILGARTWSAMRPRPRVAETPAPERIPTRTPPDTIAAVRRRAPRRRLEDHHGAR